jgi:hypothetical protein
VHACLDDLVIALYVTIDELLEPRRGPGHPPKLADSELSCLAVAQVLLGYRSERRWLRAVGRRLGICPPMCAARPPTTAACAGPRRWSWPSLRPWRPARRRGVTSGGSWTPPRSPAAPPARRPGAATWPGGPAMATTPAAAAGIGASSSMSWLARTACRWPGAWPTPPTPSVRSPRAVGPGGPPAHPALWHGHLGR